MRTLHFQIAILVLFQTLFNTTTATGASEAWVQRYSNATDADDFLKKVVCGDDGSIIVVGDTRGGATGNDMLIIKYSSSGELQWVNTYNGPGNSHDEARAVALGSDGTVFVTGYSFSGTASSSSDYATIAFSNLGVPLWTNRYNGSWNGEDVPSAVVVNTNGNVLVTGYASIGSSQQDYLTIAYSSAGIPLWTNSYNGSGRDRALAAVADGNGNVFVSGYSVGAGSLEDYLTIAYSSAGLPLWTNRYTGPGAGFDGATSLAVDGEGTVYVTGYSYIGATSDSDFATIAYSNSGVALWTNRYGGTGGTGDRGEAISQKGNKVFVTGITGNDYATIAYSTLGLPLWSNRYNGPGNSTDHALDIIANTNGGIFVTGQSAGVGTGPDFATIAYSEIGTPLWTNRYNGLANSSETAYGIAADGNGNLIIVGHSDGAGGRIDAMTIKYSIAGVGLWTNRFNGAADDDDWAQAIILDDAGNVFVAGSSERANSDTDYAVIKYSGAGAAQWTNRYAGPSGGPDIPRAITTGAEGRLFVTGSSWGNGTFEDFATVAYSNDGVPLWTNRYSTYQTDVPSAIATDSNGNIAVTGRSTGNSSFLTICYSSNGAALWTSHYNVAGPVSDSAQDIVVVAHSNFVVTGTAGGALVTIKYSTTGVGVWTNIYKETASSSASAMAAATDANGNIFVTGYSLSTGSSYDIATIAYSSMGVALWTNRYDGPASGTDVATDVAVDSNGNVLVTGYSYNSGGVNPDYVTIAYSNAGELLWTSRYNGPANGEDIAYAVAVDKANTVIVTGRSIRTGILNDLATIAYSSTGMAIWTNRYIGPLTGNTEPQNTKSCLAIGPDGAVYVTGATDGDYSNTTTYDFVTVKYVAPPEIASPPTSRTNNATTMAEFIVIATGSGPLSYQWRRNGTNLFNGENVSGADSNTLTLMNVQVADADSYDVVVTNAFGSATSAGAMLTVVVPSAIILHSTTISTGVFDFAFTNTPGANFTVLATTNISLPLSNWTALGGVTETSPGQFQFTDPQATNSPQRFYRVRAN